MKHAGPVRRGLGVRTAFNLLGPLTSAGPLRLVGVPQPELTDLMAQALTLLGSERAWVFYGADGIDEMSRQAHEYPSAERHGLPFHVHPSDFGMAKAAPASARR